MYLTATIHKNSNVNDIGYFIQQQQNPNKKIIFTIYLKIIMIFFKIDNKFNSKIN